MLESLSGRGAVITGAASGLGLALAERCAREGMRLALLDRQADTLEGVAERLRSGGARVEALCVDVADWPAMQAAAATVAERLGRVQLLANNAGVATSGPLLECSVDDWRWMFEINLMGVVHGCKAFLPDMLAHGQPGQVVNTASLAGLVGPPGLSIYSASKHAIVGLSESLHHELQLMQAAVGVSLLCPGWVRTGIGGSGLDRGSRESSLGQRLAGGILRAMMSSQTQAIDVAEATLTAVREGRFWVLPHEGSSEWPRVRSDSLLAGEWPPRPDF